MQGQASLLEKGEGPMKGKVRYHFAIKYAKTRMKEEIADIPITMKHPVVLETAHRYRLQLPQLRRLVTELREERDGGG